MRTEISAYNSSLLYKQSPVSKIAKSTPNAWTSLCGYNAALMFRDPTLPAMVPQNQKELERNLTQPELSSTVPSQGICVFNDLLTMTTPKSTGTYQVPTMCPAL